MVDDVHRRGDLDDLVLLDVERQRAAHAAIRADRVGQRLRRLVPGAGRAHLVLAPEHQRAGRADTDAVAAVDAGGVGQADVPLGRDAGIEATAGDADGEGVLGIDPAGLDALVAEDALGVVAHVELVVDLDRLGDGGRRRCPRAARARRPAARRARRPRQAPPVGRSGLGRRRSEPCSPRPRARSTGRPTSRAARARACGWCARARNRS